MNRKTFAVLGLFVVLSGMAIAYGGLIGSSNLTRSAAVAVAPAAVGAGPGIVQYIPPTAGNPLNQIHVQFTGTPFDRTCVAYVEPPARPAQPVGVTGNLSGAWRAEFGNVPGVTGGVGFVLVTRSVIATPTGFMVLWEAQVMAGNNGGPFVLAGADFNCSGGNGTYSVTVSP